ncbi:hypothetical protein CCP2SC5_70066 [Azospirillaceae bacterium]
MRDIALFAPSLNVAFQELELRYDGPFPVGMARTVMAGGGWSVVIACVGRRSNAGMNE